MELAGVVGGRGVVHLEMNAQFFTCHTGNPNNRSSSLSVQNLGISHTACV